jgi:polyhydroxyalkanoate synthesis repressor PhaR
VHTVRRYANRKFYHLQGHRYTTLEGIASLVRAGEEVRVIDNTTGRDITPEVLAQIVAHGLGAKRASPSALTSILRTVVRLGRLPLEETLGIAVAAAGLPSRADWQRLEQRVSQLEAAVEQLFDARTRGVL